jgi:hypothetical protein
MATFAEMEAEAPELGQRARERFAATGLSLVGTLRSDGWPRISPVEPLIVDGQLYLGMMPGSMKSRDLGRDPRCLVHSTVSDNPPPDPALPPCVASACRPSGFDWAGKEGEVKLYGQARRITDEAETERYCVALEKAIGWRPKGGDDLDLWLVYLGRGAYVRFDGEQQHIATWQPGRPLRHRTKAQQA